MEHASSRVEKKRRAKAKGKFHVLLTANDAPYQRWQSRVMYYQYGKLRRAFPDSALGGFTRILHSGREDALMNEIPTVVVNTLPADIRDDGYVVLHRPYAFKQWLEKYADDIDEEFVLMSEPDHLFVRPPPLLATKTKAAAFPFFYIAPNDPKFKPIVERFNEARAAGGVRAHRIVAGDAPRRRAAARRPEVARAGGGDETGRAGQRRSCGSWRCGRTASRARRWALRTSS